MHYRVTKVTKLGYGGPGDASGVVWEGQGADEMSAQYPIRVLDGKLNDPLASSVDFAAGSTTCYIFETYVGDTVGVPYESEGRMTASHWVECGDPRHRPDEVYGLMEA